jgi:hypothetical protein
MDDDDPEKRIRELERGLAEHYPAIETPVSEAPADTSWAAPPPAVPPPVFTPPPVPMPPMQYGTGIGGPAPGLYGRGRGSVVWQRRSPAFRFVWILVAFWAVMVPVGIGLSWFMSRGNSSMNPFAPSTLTVSKGGSLSVGGNNQTKSIECNDGSVNLSGNNGSFTVTGHCAVVGVSGNNTHVTVDTADIINAGGINTVTIYHHGEPKVTKSGINVSVSSG